MGFLDKWQPQLLSVLRIVSGLLFLEHGTSKLLHFPHVAMFDGKLPVLIMVAGAIELVGGALVTARPLHPLRGLHHVGRDGGRLFHGARAQGLLPGD